MTWASFDEGFVHEAVWDNVPAEAAWYYVALATSCCRSHRWDGRIPRTALPRLANVPNTDEAIKHLVAAGLVVDDGIAVTLLYIEQHIPPEGERPEHLLPRKRRNVRDYRLRRCIEGRHSKDCPPATCPVKRAKYRSADDHA